MKHTSSFLAAAGLLAALTLSQSAGAVTTVCVAVHNRSWSTPPEGALQTPKGGAEQGKSPSAPASQPEQGAAPKPVAETPAAAADAKPKAAFPATDAAAPATDAKKDANPQPWEAYKASPGATQSAQKIPTVVLDSAPDPAVYLTRLLQYEVTHHPDYDAVEKDCQQHIDVELYSVGSGYTVFARYSGFANEEKVRYTEFSEFDRLASRLVRSLLNNRPLSETIRRQDVLKADSERSLQSIGVQGLALFGLGTAVRVARLPTAPENDPESVTKIRTRWMMPATIRLGYRGKFNAWGLDAFAHLDIGSQERAVSKNIPGGHVDYLGAGGVGLHFMRYLDPDGMTSMYLGGGATFNLTLFDAIRAPQYRATDPRSTLVASGLDADLFVGYEFLRASALHFFTQAELNAPIYTVHADAGPSTVNTYMPGGQLLIGMMF